MRKPNIWMISASYYPHIGGGEQQLQRLSEQLIPMGWQLAIITRRHNPRYDYIPPASETIHGVPVYRMPSPGKGPIGSLCFLIFAFLFLASKRGNNIYHAHGIGTPAWIALLCRYLLGGKAIIRLRTGVEQYKVIRKSRFGYLSLNLQLKLADKLIVLNRCLIDELQTWGIPKNRLFFFPNCIDTNQYQPTDKQPNTETGHKRIFIYVGRLEYWKGVDVLLDAWANYMCKLTPASELWIVGDGPDRQKLEKQTADLKIVKSTHFLGKREDILQLLHQSNILVLPSRTEGLSNAMIEAMACGLPVICTAVGGAPDWIIPGKNGLLVQPKDHLGLGYALAWMLSHESTWNEMGASARQTIKNHMSWDSQIANMETFYHQLF